MRERDVFIEALDAQPADRAAVLEHACGGDAALRAQVERLLIEHDRKQSFILDRPPADVDATLDFEQLAERPGASVGPYKLLQQIGEGGMGVVFMAEQTVPLRRTVAVKIIKQGMDTRQVIARFEAERQALALMDHPNIAKVLDAGTTASGRPYFVMELVKGVPITQYCDQKRLPLRERLRILLPVCQAVQHAHQKGLIHRDIKPSNVLVAEYDDHAVPKVIDFGVAKATAQKLTDRTMFTEFGQLIGTLEYMSPEQAKFNQLDIDTRSDIYSLGVLLYELLTGSTPFGRERLSEGAFDEMLRIIREEEPPKPSTRLSTTGLLPDVAASRGQERGKLSGLVRGELDWIVMKALEKDRNRRYETASAFAADVDRYLQNEPVVARGVSTAYRLRKFIRRNRVGVLAGSAIAAALLLGTTLSAIGFVQARRQAVRADREASNSRTETANAILSQRQTEAALIEKDAALKAVQEKELLQRRRFHSAQTNLAQQALAAGDPARVLDLLESNRPQSGESDLRGFEWYYLWQQIQPGLRASCVHPSDAVGHWGLAASPDGSMIAATCGEGNVAMLTLWSTATGKLLRTLPMRESWLTLVAFSPDGKSVACGSASSAIYLWNLADGSAITNASLNLGLNRSLQFAPDGTSLAAGFETGAVRILDTESLKTIAALKQHGGPVLNACYSPDGARLYTAAAWGNEDTLTRVHDMTQSPPGVVDELKDFRVTDISPDGRFLVGGWNRLTLWNIAEKEAIWHFNPHDGIVNDVKFTPDGHSLISAGRQDRLAIVWDIAARKAITRVPHLAQVTAVSWAGQKGGAWASLSDDGTVKIWELRPGVDQSIIRLDQPIKTMVAMPVGHAVLLGGDFQAKAWDLNAGTFHDNLSAARYVRGISTDGRWLASTDPVGPDKKPGVKTWDLTSGDLQHSIAMPDSKFPTGIRISPDGKRLANPGQGEPIQIWDLTSKEVELPAPLTIQPDAKCVSLDFSPDGRLLAAACQFGRINLYDLETNEFVRLSLPRSPWTQQVAFSGDGKLLAAGNDVGLVCVFDVETTNMIASLGGHEAGIAALTFFPDGRTLAVACRNTIRLWDVPSNQEKITLSVPAGADVSKPVEVLYLAITPDGKNLLSRQSDGTVRVWRSAGVEADPVGVARIE